MQDKEVSIQQLEILGREAFARLKRIWASSSPYGEELSEKFRAPLETKMRLPIDERIQWLENLGLNIVKKGLFDFEGDPRSLAVRLLTGTENYGAEDYVPVVKFVINELEMGGLEVPAQVKADIESVRNWMNTKYGSNI
jgi:hypothetical protein